MFSKKALFITALIGTLFVAGCGQNKKDAPKATGSTVKAQITFNGSSTLSPVISKVGNDFTKKYTKWKGANSSLPDAPIQIIVAPGGSGAGIKAVLDKKADFGLVAREVKSTEKEKIKDFKDYKVGIDALTIAVNPNNPIVKLKNNLTSEEIRKIFSGEYKTWKDVDASLPDTEIVVVTRDLGGGAHEVFQQKIMGKSKVTNKAIQAPSMGALVAKVIENQNAIGYASYGVSAQNKGKLVPMKVDGVEADEKTILDGSYKIQRPLLVVGSGTLTPIQKAFMDYLLSPDGIKVVKELGFVPVKK